MKSTRAFILVLLTAVFLAACGSTPGEAAQSFIQMPAGDGMETAVPEANPSSSQPGSQATWPDGQAQQDAQGQVEVTVTPLNLSSHNETLDFDVVMNTHSVELSLDLAALATLRTDTGLTVSATAWSAPGGGHHVAGALQFPAVVDGTHILDDASRLTLTIRDVDVPERVFIWNLVE